MMKEASYGIIPCRRTSSGWEVFLVQLHAGHWGFPKGHPDGAEEPFETAKRELYEETKLTVGKLLHDQPFQESYTFGETSKTVTYFLAEVTGEPITQSAEVAASGWYPLDQVERRLTFPELKSLWLKNKTLLS